MLAGIPFYFMWEKGTTPNSKVYAYFGSSLLAGLCCTFALRFVLHVNHISLWLALTYLLLGAQANYLLALLFLQKQRWQQAAILSLKTACGGILLAFFFYNLNIDNLNQEGIAVHFLTVNVKNASIMILGGTAIWLYGSYFFEKHPRAAKLLHTAIILFLPFILYFITELSWNVSLFEMKLVYVLLNIAIYTLLEILALNLFWSVSAGITATMLFCWLTGCVNYFVVEFRGSPIMAVDFWGIQTALSVADDYTFRMTDGMGMSLLILYVVFACTMASAKQARELLVKVRRTVFRALVAIISFLSLIVWVTFGDFEKTYSIWMDLWTPVSTYRIAGFAPAFIAYLQNMKIDKPEGYAASAVANILTPYLDEETKDSSEQTETASTVKPTVIAIMNESFSDLSCIGPFAAVNEDLAYFHALKDDPGIIAYGNNYVSTRGGGTSTTEFEYLTGNSMSYAAGSNPYAEFHFSGVPNLARQFQSQGYKTIAMHPENPVNWRRNSVYPAMGFDEFYSINDYTDSERTAWNRVSDAADYEKLIEIYEQQDSPSFIFNVTMQNHGSYGTDTLNELPEEERVDVDPAYNMYDDVRSYQSLIRKADRALEAFMDYFRNVDEPVIICFFGDHQPALNTDFEQALRESGRTETDTDLSLEEKYYITPYFIWSNYDVEKPLLKQTADSIEITSTNYLGVLTKYYAGIPLSAFDRFLLAQRAEMPVLNFLGFYGNDAKWHALTEETDWQVQLKNYELIQYNTLFDSEKNQKFFIP